MPTIQSFINKFRSSKAGNTKRGSETTEVAPGPDAAMAELATKLADKRGDKVSTGPAQPADDATARLVERANMARIVDHRDEDHLISE